MSRRPIRGETVNAAGSAQVALPGGVYIVRAGQQATRLIVE